jgi:predicted TIM-barrel fold metal-dependent hydrolase
MRRYKDKILFGSDALIGQPETVHSAREFFLNYIDDPELLKKIFNNNYLKFHEHHGKLEL